MAAKKAKKKVKAAGAARKTAAKRTAKAVKKTAKKTGAKKAKAAARKPAKAGASARAGATKTKTKAPARKKKQVVGEGDYAASRAFLKDQSSFVQKNRAKIPALGKAAKAALEGAEGPALLAAEAEARSHSKGDRAED